MSEVLSPGVAYGWFELLDWLGQAPMPVTAARTLGKLGVVSAKRVTDCSLLLGWTEVNDAGLPVSYTHLDVYKRQPEHCS